MSYLIFFCLLLQIPVEFEPAHIQQATPVQTNISVVSSTWVVLDLPVTMEGRVQFPKMLYGPEQLGKDILWSVSNWRFTPARTVSELDSHVGAVFLYRGADMFPNPPPNFFATPAGAADRPPIPISVTDPGYLPNSIAEGDVVLELRLTEAGSVANVYAITLIPGLTEFTQAAVRSWRFAPALSGGQPVPGTVIVTVSYLRPVVAQLR